jgi:transposase/DNA-binding CsgD family transcriptional regulator
MEAWPQSLLARLQILGEQPLEAAYRRKLEAVILLLQGRAAAEIEYRANASLRSVQRWAASVRQSGPDALRRGHPHRRGKLNDDQQAQLAADVRRAPLGFGYRESRWSAALLRRHVCQNYGARFSLRHCRRLLAAHGAKDATFHSTRRERQPRQTAADRRGELFPRTLSDSERKRRALARIKRLASSGLPLQPLAYTLFDLVHEAVPYDEASPGLATESLTGPRWIARGFDYDRWFPQMQKYLIEAKPEVSGLRSPSLLPQNPLTVLRHEQIVQPNYYSSEGYNEFFRHMGMHHGILTVLRDEPRNFLGYYPVFRSNGMKPFTRDDADFFKAAATHIAHGVRTAGLIACQPVKEEAFEQFQKVPRGVVVMDRAGTVLSLNKAAQSLFRQFSVYDNWETHNSNNGRLSAQLRYVAHQLRAIFGDRDETAADANCPLVRMYSHRTGAMLRLSGFASDLGDGHFTVLIELGETEDLFRQRLMARYALSARQAQMLILLRRGATTSAIAARLQAQLSGLKSSLRELRLKFDLPDQSSLREFARSISPYSMSAEPR